MHRHLSISSREKQKKQLSSRSKYNSTRREEEPGKSFCRRCFLPYPNNTNKHKKKERRICLLMACSKGQEKRQEMFLSRSIRSIFVNSFFLIDADLGYTHRNGVIFWMFGCVLLCWSNWRYLIGRQNQGTSPGSTVSLLQAHPANTPQKRGKCPY